MNIPTSPQGRLDCDLCVIGAGSAGLSVAAGASQMGARVVLVERGRMGGDCLNTGCVPSKSLIAAAHAAHTAVTSGRFGVRFEPPAISYASVHAHVHDVIARIAPHDSVERFEGLGVKVVRAQARFTAPDEVQAGDLRIKARRFVIATGSSALMPQLAGLENCRPLTNETIFDLKELPERLIVVGAGPIGLELAQAYRRLGSQVIILARSNLLSRDEPEAVAVVENQLKLEGIEIFKSCSVRNFNRDGDVVHVELAHNASPMKLSGTHLLVAAGRKPNTEGLGLAAAGIGETANGIQVDQGLRTANRKVYAIGDVVGGPQFTHVAGYHAGLVIRNALLSLPVKVNYGALPWVTYTDPELAHVGLTEGEARKAGQQLTVLQETFAANDRAQAERRTEGLIKIILGKRARVLGATIVGPHAGEMIGLWSLAISKNLSVSDVAKLMLPYPTMSELSKKVAGSFYTPTIFGKKVRMLTRFIQQLVP